MEKVAIFLKKGIAQTIDGNNKSKTAADEEIKPTRNWVKE